MSQASDLRRGPAARAALVLAWAGLGLLGGPAPARAGDGMSFRVVEVGGRPVKGAIVRLLPMGGASWTHPSREPDDLPPPMTTGADGVASIVGYWASEVCVLVHDGKHAAMNCGLTPGKGPMEISLGEARVVSLRPVDAKGRAVKDARLRLVFSGGPEIHGVDAEAVNGVHRFPPLPLACFRRSTHIEARADGFFVGPYETPPDSGPNGTELRLLPTRTVTGRVVRPDGSPAAGAKVWLANDDGNDDGVVSGPDGRFRLPGVPVGAGREVVVLAEGFAPRSAGSPDPGDELGDIALARGLFLTGRVREADGTRVERAFLAISRGGQRVANGDAMRGGSFTLGPLDDGEYDLEIFLHQSAGVAGWRRLIQRVRAGTESLEFVVPTGLRILLRDAAGSPVTSEDAETEISEAGRPAPWKEHFNGSGAFTELRMQADPRVAYKVTVRVAGFEPATGSATTDDAGTAEVEMRLKPAGK